MRKRKPETESQIHRPLSERLRKDWRKNKMLYLLFLPVFLWYLVFQYGSMAGLSIAFENYKPSLGVFGSPFVGLKHFKAFFSDYYFKRVLTNTIRISLCTLVFTFPAPVILALLINELKSRRYSRIVQTITYIPHFIYSYPAEESLNLSKAVMDGWGDDAVAILRRLLAENERNGVSPLDERYFLYSVSSTVFSCAQRLTERYGSAVEPFKPPQVLQAHDLEKARERLEEGMMRLSQSVLRIRQELGSGDDGNYLLYKKAIEMITSGYTDPSLNVSSIADDLGVSLGHLSKSFKRYHGMNISDYISSYRVQSAKRLLLGDLSVGEVAERSGFGSLRTFMRVFKNLEGVTPGQYKALNTEEEG